VEINFTIAVFYVNLQDNHLSDSAEKNPLRHDVASTRETEWTNKQSCDDINSEY
jgi:hypothetical protein